VENPHKAVIALGSNLDSSAGDPAATVAAAIALIGQLKGVKLIAASQPVTSAPAYRADQPEFTNAVILVEVADGHPLTLLRTLQTIEQDFAREHTLVNGPRTLDLDLIDFEGVLSDDPELLLPHPLALERDFVLEPLLSIAPGYVFADGSVVKEHTGTTGDKQQTGGLLMICATPIGNLGDLTQRVVEALASADLILAEDTRVTRKLLTHLNLRAPLQRCDEQVIRAKTAGYIQQIQAGSKIAYVSDAGTPGVSDPGMHLVAAARQSGVDVSVLPGASAVTAAIAAAGFEATAFYFGGFLPRKDKQRRELLTQLEALDAVLVFYESPHRICDTLAAIAEVFPAREVVMARELTKLYEEVIRAPSGELAQQIAARTAQQAIKGEIVVVIGPPPKRQSQRQHRDKYASKLPRK
jgi:16S rRNA (cytidine1402-2'-O)-methyltransferase